MEQTRAEPSVRVPGAPGEQPPEERAPGEQPRAGHAGGGHARGEHVHSEPSPPRTVPAPSSPEVPAPPQQAPPQPQPQPQHQPHVQAGNEAEGPPKPVRPQRHSVRAQVLTALREALFSGELAPGLVYSAPALGARFGVSATPVREAMQQLVAEGAVETVPNRGFRVAECGPDDLAELAEIRLLLEVPAVLRAARSVPAAYWDGLRPLADDTLAAAARGDHPAYADADRAFHGALLEPAGNRRLVAVAEDVQRRAQRGPAASAAPGLLATELLGEASEHVALLDALCARDLDEAEALLQAHVMH